MQFGSNLRSSFEEDVQGITNTCKQVSFKKGGLEGEPGSQPTRVSTQQLKKSLLGPVWRYTDKGGRKKHKANKSRLRTIGGSIWWADSLSSSLYDVIVVGIIVVVVVVVIGGAGVAGVGGSVECCFTNL